MKISATVIYKPRKGKLLFSHWGLQEIRCTLNFDKQWWSLRISNWHNIRVLCCVWVIFVIEFELHLSVTNFVVPCVVWYNLDIKINGSGLKMIDGFHPHEQRPCNKKNALHKSRIQFTENCFGPPTWLAFICLGLPFDLETSQLFLC